MIALKTMRGKRANEGHVIIHWFWHGERTLGNYLFRKKSIEHVERAFFPSPQMTQTKRRKRNLKKKKKKKWFRRSKTLVLPSLLGSRETTYNICCRGMFGGIAGHESFCLRVAYFSPTRCLRRGSSFIFEFWPCKLRGLRLCRKGNGTVPLAFVSQQTSCHP